MKLRPMILLGLGLLSAGLVILVLALAPRAGPPVDVLYDNSGVATLNGIYFDSIVIHNHGTSNATVVVEVQTSLDTKPRFSDPVTLCGNCTETVLIEELQPQQNQTSNQYAYYTYAIVNPQSIRVEYLSTVLQSRSTVYYPEIGAAIILVGLFFLIREASGSRGSRRISRTHSGQRRRLRLSDVES